MTRAVLPLTLLTVSLLAFLLWVITDLPAPAVAPEAPPPPFHEVEIRERIFSQMTKEEMRECFANAPILGKVGDVRIEPRALIVELILQGDAAGQLKPYALEAARGGARTYECHGDMFGRRRILAPLIVFPPPDGVIVLHPDGTRQEAEQCPAGYQRKHRYGWRFCLTPDHPVPIPPLWAAPIAGIPYEKAQAIFEQYKPRYESIWGVRAVALTVYGLTIRLLLGVRVEEFTEALPYDLRQLHASLPLEIDGLPIHIVHEPSGSGLAYSQAGTEDGTMP